MGRAESSAGNVNIRRICGKVTILVVWDSMSIGWEGGACSNRSTLCADLSQKTFERSWNNQMTE